MAPITTWAQLSSLDVREDEDHPYMETTQERVRITKQSLILIIKCKENIRLSEV